MTTTKKIILSIVAIVGIGAAAADGYLAWLAFSRISEEVTQHGHLIDEIKSRMEADRAQLEDDRASLYADMQASLNATLQGLNETQHILIDEFRAVYCTKDDRHDKSFQIGQAAALSRLAIKSNLGDLALAEYAKCKLTPN